MYDRYKPGPLAFYEHAATENTIQTLKEGFRRGGCLREILTDHGTQSTGTTTTNHT